MLALLATACGSAPIPHDQMASAEAEIRAAQVVVEDLRSQGPNDDLPKAELHLKMARDQVTTAKRLISEKENAEAARTLERAEIDASYALALAKQAQAETEAMRVVEEVQKLKQQLGKSK
jgi:hypothetical protein